jgi:hypothetical protein
MSSSTRERGRSTREAQIQSVLGAYSGARAVLNGHGLSFTRPYVPLRIAARCLVLRPFVPYIAARGIAEVEQLLSKL